ncbi:hypothetical protein GWK47_052740 [Chionoecetes opilio]|uniref:Uncharacterized protein n=1 Tax=Chionoecetes opilio TaxID=41210 RepID=A0A8J5CR87_CHIOP|nr:hypothetical protein GWK47_052740 [Chionoecetes opilio]
MWSCAPPRTTPRETPPGPVGGLVPPKPDARDAPDITKDRGGGGTPPPKAEKPPSPKPLSGPTLADLLGGSPDPGLAFKILNHTRTFLHKSGQLHRI